MFFHVEIKCSLKIGNDIHPQLIAMFQELQKGWVPPSYISEEEYIKVKDNREKYPDYYVGYVGFNATFSAKYFGGYARGFKADGITPRYLSNEAYRNIMKQVPKLKDIQYICSDYYDNEFCELHNAAIYCDPPYENTTKYATGNFDYERFWSWCRKMSRTNKVFISSYNAPNDFECIWQKDTLANFDANRGNNTDKKKRTEKLFVYNNR